MFNYFAMVWLFVITLWVSPLTLMSYEEDPDRFYKKSRLSPISNHFDETLSTKDLIEAYKQDIERSNDRILSAFDEAKSAFENDTLNMNRRDAAHIHQRGIYKAKHTRKLSIIIPKKTLPRAFPLGLSPSDERHQIYNDFSKTLERFSPEILPPLAPLPENCGFFPSENRNNGKISDDEKYFSPKKDERLINEVLYSERWNNPDFFQDISLTPSPKYAHTPALSEDDSPYRFMNKAILLKEDTESDDDDDTSSSSSPLEASSALLDHEIMDDFNSWKASLCNTFSSMFQ
jgi:hypothetical protein